MELCHLTYNILILVKFRHYLQKSCIYYCMQRAYCLKNKKRWSRKTKLRIAIFAFLCFVFLFFIYYFKVVCPVVIKLSEEKVRAVATKTISRVVGDVMLEDGVSYDKIVNIAYSSDNEVEFVEVDSVEVNLIIRDITKRVQDEFENLGKECINIALGTFSGIPFLYNLGPNVSLRLVPIGIVNTSIQSNFTSAGLNQTLHRLNFVVSANIGMILPGKNQNFITELEVMLCESVIVGKIPQIYLNA